MDELTVRNVDVLGDTIVAGQDKKGQIWAGVSFFCKALGMTNKQRDNQVAKVQSDKTLCKGTLKFREGVFDPANEVVAIKVDFIPLWLAKIQITKKMEHDHPELADKLLEYQLKAKDILADAFLPKQENGGDVQGQIKLLAQGTTQLYERVESVESRITSLEDTMTLDYGQQRSLGEIVNKTVMTALGGHNAPAYKEIGRKVFAECNHDLKTYFNVNARANVPKKRYKEAVEYAKSWKPCTNTMMWIENANAQQSLDLEGGAAR